jgi:hypothetical protein
MPQAEGVVATMTIDDGWGDGWTDNVPPASQRKHGPGRTPAGRPVPREPSWGRVLLTTVELWASRRLRRAGTARVLVAAGLVAVVAALAALYFTGTFSQAAPSAAANSVPQSAQAAQAAASAKAMPSATARPSVPAASARPVTAAESAAASWIADQVSSAAVIGCSPVMCTALQAQGLSASRMVTLAPGLSDVQRADVIATDAVYGQGQAARLQQYAPGLVASFGSGRAQVEVRAVAPKGAAAYQSAVRADRSARESAGAQLLRNSNLAFSPAESAQLRAGEVDTRLLATLAELSTQVKLRVVAFGGASPGVAPLFRAVTLGAAGGNPGSSLGTALSMVSTQEGAYRPMRATLLKSGAGLAELVIQFASPSPLGLLSPVLSADRQPAPAGS